MYLFLLIFTDTFTLWGCATVLWAQKCFTLTKNYSYLSNTTHCERFFEWYFLYFYICSECVPIIPEALFENKFCYAHLPRIKFVFIFLESKSNNLKRISTNGKVRAYKFESTDWNKLAHNLSKNIAFTQTHTHIVFSKKFLFFGSFYLFVTKYPFGNTLTSLWIMSRRYKCSY